jgi:hypothetical protein
MRSECIVRSFLQKQQAFLDFALDQYTTESVDQLVADKLISLRNPAPNCGIGGCSSVEFGVYEEVEVFK